MERMKSTPRSGIYQLTSIINGKVYIGSSVDLMRRKDDHFKELNRKNHYNPHLQNHINKYGVNDLQFSIIEICPKEVVLEREAYWINERCLFSETGKQLGFNICKIPNQVMGGRNHSEETKLKMSKSHSTPEQIEIARQSIKKVQANNIGKHHKYTRHKEYPKRSTKSIDQYDLKGSYIKTFNSLKEAKISLGISMGTISACLTGSNNGNYSAGGFLWTYKGLPVNEKLVNYNHKRKHVFQFDLKWNFIAEYPGILETSNATGVKKSTIAACIRKGSVDCYGSKFIFRNEMHYVPYTPVPIKEHPLLSIANISHTVNESCRIKEFQLSLSL